MIVSVPVSVGADAFFVQSSAVGPAFAAGPDAAYFGFLLLDASLSILPLLGSGNPASCVDDTRCRQLARLSHCLSGLIVSKDLAAKELVPELSNAT